MNKARYCLIFLPPTFAPQTQAMLTVHTFTFGPFQENTYVVSAPGGQCLVIDPGMSDRAECTEFSAFLEAEQLHPVQLINTHCHIDHVLGNYYVFEHYGLSPCAHVLERATLARGEQSAQLFGLNYQPSPDITTLLDEPGSVALEENRLDILFVPGHAPGHIALVYPEGAWVIGGDVLFRNSVGRVDLPGCDAKALVDSIQQKFYRLPGDYTVYPGHGPVTTIGEEKSGNAFVRENSQYLIA